MMTWILLEHQIPEAAQCEMLMGKKHPLGRIKALQNNGSPKTETRWKMRRTEMLIIESEQLVTYTVAKLIEALRGRKQHVRAKANNYETTKHTDV